ncbi:LysR family transcriptional regulator [Labrys monachus]|uniref:DNA-binding transcriptional LysR family regulator n=1 Tax=Labrys monachus TaxID=217067 RepID=A0ABU0FCU9_9HYPH|nr:LysR family transcriptional regulator [Labrys monachus]MDQ0392147.1 DNA-binding transcriptional LysR family regulator [Labrys monachus]
MVYIYHMRDVHLKAIDLNLLTALGALLAHRSVSRAARDIGLSQPAMSRALDRLRHLFGDELMLRSGAGMVLTARAEALAPRIHAILADIGDVVAEPRFDPASERRTIRIAAVDSQTALFFPGVMARLMKEAPEVDLRAMPLGPDIASRMQAGEIDMTFSLATYPLPAGAHSELLLEDSLALVMRRGHPAARNPAPSLADYARFSHVTVSIFGDGHTEADSTLAAAGLERRVALTTPHFTAALAVVARTDMVTTLSRAFARRFADAFDLVLAEPPLERTALPLTMVWPAARKNDRLLAWLRGIFKQTAAEIGDPHLPPIRSGRIGGGSQNHR